MANDSFSENISMVCMCSGITYSCPWWHPCDNGGLFRIQPLVNLHNRRNPKGIVSTCFYHVLMSGSKKTCKNPSKLFKNQHGNQTSQVPSSFCRSDLCPKQSWVKDLVRPDGLFAMPLHGGWLNGPWVLESSMWYISSDSVFLPHRSEFCWILTKKTRV